MKEFFTYVGAFIALANLLWFARGMWIGKIPASTAASFLMWTILDAIILGSTYMAGKSIWLALGYTVGAFAVTTAAIVRGKWLWSYKETICAISAAIAMYISFKWGARCGVFASVIAMNVAGLPMMVDQWHNPIRESAPVWVITVLACIFTLLGSEISWTSMILAGAGVVYNGSMAAIVLLKEPRVQEPEIIV
ncbi:MAG: hypothetical protein WCQ60_04020 [bacterium]